jgi:MerR family transcriptional regulator, light-induced transcriptional regulator
MSTLTLQEAANELGVHYMTAYRYVRTGRLEAVQHSGVWQVKRSDLDRFRLAPPARVRAPQRAASQNRLRTVLVKGDEAGAWKVIEDSLTGGASAQQIQQDLLVPAMNEIGQLWRSGDLSLAGEHVASATMSRLVGRLGPRFVKRGRTRGTVVIGAVSGDEHALPCHFMADLIRGEGYAVRDLGANSPAESFVSVAGSADRLVSVAITVTAMGLDDQVLVTTTALKASMCGTDLQEIPVFVGGGAIVDASHARGLGSSGWSATAAGAVDLILRREAS